MRAVVAYERTVALLVVDVQNDFADPSGSLSVRGAAEVVPIVNAEIERAAAAGAPVFYTQDWHPASTPHFAKDGGIWPVHCVQETWGAAFHPDLVVGESVVRKGSNGEDGYSGFTMRDPTSGQTIPTALHGLLRDAGVKSVVIVGLATDYCVKATALDAKALGYPATVLTAGVRAVDLQAGDGERAIREMEDAGVTIESSFESASP
jgi:nicotinamidase/pyrazinamidase